MDRLALVRYFVRLGNHILCVGLAAKYQEETRTSTPRVSVLLSSLDGDSTIDVQLLGNRTSHFRWADL